MGYVGGGGRNCEAMPREASPDPVGRQGLGSLISCLEMRKGGFGEHQALEPWGRQLPYARGSSLLSDQILTPDPEGWCVRPPSH